MQTRIVTRIIDETIRQDFRPSFDSLEENHHYLTLEADWQVWETRPAMATPRDHAVVLSLARLCERVMGAPAQVGFRGRVGASANGSHMAAARIDTVMYSPCRGEEECGYELRSDPWKGRLMRGSR
jgi:hypothetical protein